MTVESDSSPECFSQMMARLPGFRFHPTDEELIMYYLKRKMAGRKLKLNVIRETDVYKWDPQELPGQSILKTGDRQWFFFSARDRKYPNAARSNRGTRHGYWKATGKDRNVTCNSRTVGLKKTLIFYKGRAPNGERTDWVMHEYTMDEIELQRWKGFKDYFALYKLYKKSGAGPKNGEQYGAPFNEEEWVDDDFVDFNIKSADSEVPTQQLDVTSVDVVTANGPVQPLSDDEIEDIVKRIMDDESLFDQVVSEGTQSDVVDQFFRDIAFPETNRISYPSFQQHEVETSSNFPQSVISHLQMSEAPVVISAPDIQGKELSLREDDFLEFDDLIGPEHALPNVNVPGEILQFEDGLSELDLYHDTQMFLHDVCQETVSQPYMHALDTSNIVNQGYELLCTQEDAIQTSCELWIPADYSEGSLSLPISGAVPECVNFPTESNETQSEPVGGFEASRFSSSLWDFVDSIPTTPASASESSSVNRACEIMSSFKKLKDSNKNTHGTEGNATKTMKEAGRKGSVYFLFFPVLVALCAFLWVSIGTTLLGRCKSW